MIQSYSLKDLELVVLKNSLCTLRAIAVLKSFDYVVAIHEKLFNSWITNKLNKRL